MKTWERLRLTQVGIGVLLVGVLGIVGRPAAAQRSIRVPCRAAIKGQPKVCIDFPREGVTVTGSNLLVVLKADGVAIAAVSEAKAGGAHYHLFLDVDLPPAGEPIPQGAGITHLGGGEKEYVLGNLSPGLHRLIAVLGDNTHVPVARQQSDTAYFAVAAP
jgi:hypothetical protein